MKFKINYYIENFFNIISQKEVMENIMKSFSWLILSVLPVIPIKKTLVLNLYFPAFTLFIFYIILFTFSMVFLGKHVLPIIIDGILYGSNSNEKINSINNLCINFFNFYKLNIKDVYIKFALVVIFAFFVYIAWISLNLLESYNI